MFERTAVGSSESLEVLSCLSQTKLGIRSTAHFIGIVIILAIIFPKTYRTDLEAAATAQRKIATARTAVCWPLFCGLIGVVKSHGARRV